MGDDLNQPSLGVGITIIEKDKILLTKRRDFPVWCTPGGHLLPGESLIDAATREAKEETGLDVEIVNLVGVYSMPNKWETGSCEIILRACRIGGELLRSTNETVDASYFTLDQLPDDLIGWQYHQVSDALSNKVGIVSILDTRLSLEQFREAASKYKDRESLENLEWFDQICERPTRIDLVSE